MSTKSYRVTMFDRNAIRPNIEFIVDAETKPMAIAVAREALHKKGMAQIELMTNGMAVCTTTMLNSKGEAVTCTMRQISPEYYNTLLDECWGIAACDVVVAISSGVSSESAVAKADARLESAQNDCENNEQGASAVTRRKRRWTKAEKRAAKAAREAGFTVAA